MAIQMRRGAYAEFDPLKMKAGEWAVSTDSDTKKQQIWMCFAPGIVKRMGTVEDFDTEIQRLIQSYLDGMAQSVSQAQKSAELATSKAQESSTSASNAKTSETNAKTSETNASNSATKARNSETNAKASETKAKASETSASTSASNAKASETNSKTSETNAKKSETNASTSAANAKNSETNAKASATSASTFASNAKTSETKAKASETNAKTSETNSAKSESEAQKYAEQVKEISESFSGALRPLGTINFADLPSTADANSGDMYNITDQFTTTTDFKEGAGNIIPAGSNVYLTIDRYWDVLAGTPVTGVKGNAEKLYRRGNINITPADIGALATTGNASNTTVIFAEPAVRENIASKEKLSVSFGKIRKWFSSLKDFVFNDLVNNLTTTTTGSALDASQGKILNDKYDELNQSLDSLANGKITIKNDIMGTMIGKICFIYYKHTTAGVVKNKEYFLENVTNLGLSLPLMNTDGKTFPVLTSPMFMVSGDWSTPTAAIAALQLKADGTLSWVSSHGHTEPLTYMGFIAYIAK